MKKFISGIFALLLLLPGITSAAIARDSFLATGDLNSTNASFGYTVNDNTSGLLLAFVSLGKTGATSITAISYGGVAMTRMTSEFGSGGGGVNTYDIYYLLNPPLGTNTFAVATNLANSLTDVILVSYTGVLQSAPPDANGTGSPFNTGIASSLTASITPVASNVWGVMFARNNNAAPYTAGANTTKLVSDSAGRNITLFDTNGPHTGTFTMGFTSSSQINHVSYFSIAPAPIAAPVKVPDIIEMF